MERRLTAILAADVVGYTRLMRSDEAGTLARLTDLFQAQVKPAISERNGRVVKLMGDGALVEFPSVLEAVECALSIQRRVARLEQADAQRLELRIGVNIGDVIVRDGDIFGDGVNIAARLEGLSPPGGICISEDAHRQINGKLAVQFHDMGEQQLKNVDAPVRAYSVDPDPARLTPETFEELTGERLDLPEQPSIAVLPFDNLSGEAGQGYFADGLTEDIITALSHVVGLVVMARNSTFVYKGRSVDVRQVGRDLGVQYVLEGSVRKAGNRIRLTAQLIECQTGAHVWADRYDRDLKDIFQVQDELTREIAITLAVNLTYGEEMRVWADNTPHLEAWEMMLQALQLTYRFTKEGHLEAERLYRKAIALDPKFLGFRVGLGWTLAAGARFGFMPDATAAIAEARALSDQLLKEDSGMADAYGLRGYILTNLMEFDAAIDSCKKAIELRPNVSLYHASLCIAHNYAGDHAAALNCMRKAMRLSPYCPDWYLTHLGDAYRGVGDLEKARTVYTHLQTRMPDSLLSQTRMAVIHADFDDMAKAAKSVQAVLSINPQFSVDGFLALVPFRTEALRDDLRASMLKAGLPE